MVCNEQVARYVAAISSRASIRSIVIPKDSLMAKTE